MIGEPQLRQKIRCTPGEDSKSPRLSAPATSRNSAGLT
jgi:hypothetical protein